MLQIIPIAALDTNYFWLIRPNAQQPLVYLVDVGDAKAVLKVLQQEQLTLGAILITHHHHDHTDGIAELLAHHPVPVYGPDSSAIPLIEHRLIAGDQLQLDGVSFQVLGVPGHTMDHIAYLLDPIADKSTASTKLEDQPQRLFCGDALFAGGCGRRFEGSAELMWDSLTRLSALPDTTLIYCAHEYTLANLHFALEVEPDNQALQARLSNVKQLRQEKKMTIPSTIGIENRTNPFLRCHLTQLKDYAQHHAQKELKTPADVFGELRRIKDTWQ